MEQNKYLENRIVGLVKFTFQIWKGIELKCFDGILIEFLDGIQKVKRRSTDRHLYDSRSVLRMSTYINRRGGPGTRMLTYFQVSSHNFSSKACLSTAVGKVFSNQAGIYLPYFDIFETMLAMFSHC